MIRSLVDSLENVSNGRILVVGDVMLDRYWWGSVSRISPEAPVPVVRLKDTSVAAGGAANVAANIAGLGAAPILVGAVGDDVDAGLFPGVLARSGVSADDLISIPGRPTTVKTRVIAHSQQVTRVDQETDVPLSTQSEDLVIERIHGWLDTITAIVISDYAKGFLTDRILSETISAASSRRLPILVDPKGRDYEKYRGATLLTPNRREAAEACNFDDNGRELLIARAGEQLMRTFSFDSVLITQGEDGMTLFQAGKEPIHLSAAAREVYDVTGAGDTVIATLAAAIGSSADLETAAQLANRAAGLVVQQVGTTVVSQAALRNELDNN
ncbi:MAG: D-glycero-beta-D-manno-heptose-7-phosphate kinase [Pyrinomonadaceae bacterium]